MARAAPRSHVYLPRQGRTSNASAAMNCTEADSAKYRRRGAWRCTVVRQRDRRLRDSVAGGAPCVSSLPRLSTSRALLHVDRNFDPGILAPNARDVFRRIPLDDQDDRHHISKEHRHVATSPPNNFCRCRRERALVQKIVAAGACRVQTSTRTSAPAKSCSPVADVAPGCGSIVVQRVVGAGVRDLNTRCAIWHESVPELASAGGIFAQVEGHARRRDTSYPHRHRPRLGLCPPQVYLGINAQVECKVQLLHLLSRTSSTADVGAESDPQALQARGDRPRARHVSLPFRVVGKGRHRRLLAPSSCLTANASRLRWWGIADGVRRALTTVVMDGARAAARAGHRRRAERRRQSCRQFLYRGRPHFRARRD